MEVVAPEVGRTGVPRVGVLIPALDEEEALPLVLAEIPLESVHRVVVVDNGSTDRTGEVALAGGAELEREPVRGYGRACQAGIARLLDPARGDALVDGDVIVFLDADHSDHPEELPRVAGPVLAGETDLCIGSRVLGGAPWDALPAQARLGNRLACALLLALFGARHTDLGPFRAIEVRALRHLGMRDPDFGWTIEMQLKARTARLRTVEVPVRYRARIGRSKISGTLSGAVGAGVKILGWILAWRLRLWTPRGGIPRYR